MNRRVAFPFLTLSTAAVSATAWQISLDGEEWTEAGEFLTNWDHSCTMKLRRTIRLDPQLAVFDLSIPRDQLHLAMGIRIGTGQGRLPRKVLSRHRYVLGQDVWDRDVEIELLGGILSSVIDLLSEITLTTPINSTAALAPRADGDRLWADSMRVRLEGEEPRFPIETADFSTLLGDTVSASAPWHLHWTPLHWDRDFHGAVCLYLNESSTTFLERVKIEDGPTLQVLLADIMGQICERFILDPEAAEMMDRAEAGSLGAQAVTWLRKAWPGKDTAFFRSVLENRPGVFHSAFLALAELGDS
ncbi:hypothetical protein KQ307_07215 [Synechococcus sp. CS-1326]|uniref:hypothetical protein n=1 Tax=Synechococcus sp. CS-1326 TaxID=2847978 RepID=UPI00223BDB8C|nr:hypothetical protein [Synechococcus sp. CS-1326]MCT0213281.1 hypothetical protein [Synechococcus sp. CS-1326]